MSNESFDPSKYKNISEMPETEQDKFVVVPTAPGAPEAFVMASAVEEQKRERVAAEAEEIHALRESIKGAPGSTLSDAEAINKSINRLSYYSNKADNVGSTTSDTAPYSQSDMYAENMTTQRRSFENRAGGTAEKENETRGLWDKLLNKNKVDSEDIIRRQAVEMDSKISDSKKFWERKSYTDLEQAQGLEHRGYIELGDIHSATLDNEKHRRDEEIEKREEVRKNEKTGELASLLHDEWRASRKKEDGAFTPKVKVFVNTEDGKEKWFDEDKVPPIAKELKRQDIANTDYENLDPYYQGENKISAEVAMGEVYKNRNVIDDANREAFIEGASNVMHEKWLERNGSWAPPEQKLPYAELSEEEKEKDRVIIRKAIEIYQSTE